MYFQVYYHPVTRAYELLLEGIYKRIKDLTEANIKVDANVTNFVRVIKDNSLIEEYVSLDDAYVNGFVTQLTSSSDEILSTLAKAFLNRKLFKYLDVNEDIDISQFKKNKYYFNESSVSAVAYLANKGAVDSIKLLTETGEVVKLEDYSPIIKSLAESSYKKVKRIYYFEA